MSGMTGIGGWTAFWLGLFLIAGCGTSGNSLQKVNQEQAATIQGLTEEVHRLNRELEDMMSSREELLRAKSELEQRLHQELEAGNLSVSMEERGLVLTVLDRILFDSGKAELKPGSRDTLNKVAEVLRTRVGDHLIHVEGHTDNVPIRYSGWKSNWELSTARATEVIHYFVSERTLAPEGLAAIGYGEFHPVASNASEEGRLRNRRVEIVITPRKILAAASAGAAQAS